MSLSILSVELIDQKTKSIKQMCGSLFASTLLIQCCFSSLGLINSSRSVLVFRACCPQAFPSLLFLTPLLLCPFLITASHLFANLAFLAKKKPIWLSWFVFGPLTALLWARQNPLTRIHTNNFSSTCGLSFFRAVLCCLIFLVCAASNWALFESVASFFPPPQCLCIFLEMITPNKLYGVFCFASVVSHGAKAGLNRVSIKGYCICDYIKPWFEKIQRKEFLLSLIIILITYFSTLSSVVFRTFCI